MIRSEKKENFRVKKQLPFSPPSPPSSQPFFTKIHLSSDIATFKLFRLFVKVFPSGNYTELDWVN